MRGFVRHRGTSALLLATLSLGMAAAIGVFGLINGVALRPLPFPDPERLLYVDETAPSWNLTYTGINYPDFHQWRPRLGSAFEAIGMYRTAAVNLADQSGAERVRTALVSYDLTDALRIQPVLGRTFTAEEDRPGGPKVTLLGEALWRTRFGGAPNVVGQTLRIDGTPHTIVGVLPSSASFVGDSELWTLLQEAPVQDGQSYWGSAIGRMRPGVSVAAARSALIAAHQPIWAAGDTSHVVSPVLLPLREFLSTDYRLLTVLLAVGAALVLLCACANVASTMLARAIFRQREIGVRIALGANPARVTRQLLVECLALAGASGLVGVALGQWGLAAFGRATAEWLPKWIRLEPDWSVALAAIGLVAATSMLFGLAPALNARRVDGKAMVGGTGRRASLGRSERRLLHGFVIAEVILATVLLSASGMLYRGYQRVRAVDPGIRIDSVVTFQLSLPQGLYPDSTSQRVFHRRLADALSAIPAIREAGVASCVPLTGCHEGNFFEAEGAPPRRAGSTNPVTLTLGMSPAAMAALGARIIAGRAMNADDAAGRRAALVSEDFAAFHWPNVADPTGRRIRYAGGDSTRWRTVVGVVGNVRHYGLAQPTRPTVYLPGDPTMGPSIAQFGVVARISGSTVAAENAIRAAIRGLDRELAVFRWQTMDQALSRSLGLTRMLGAVLAFFAAASLVLAIGGLYGVLTYVVGRRRNELGLRVALGARPGQVIGLVVRQGLRLVAIGWAIGMPLMLVAGRALDDRLVGVRPFDPVVLVSVAVALFVVGAVASAIPGGRAAGVEPRASLTAE